MFSILDSPAGGRDCGSIDGGAVLGFDSTEDFSVVPADNTQSLLPTQTNIKDPIIQIAYCAELMRRIEQSRRDSSPAVIRPILSATGRLNNPVVKFSYD